MTLTRLLKQHCLIRKDIIENHYCVSVNSRSNDKPNDVRQLAKWFRNKNVMINLLQYNDTECSRIQRPNKQQLTVFKNKLQEKGLDVTIRESRGNKINAACGQLVSYHNKKRSMSDRNE